MQKKPKKSDDELLISAILSLESKDECRAFLQDILTINEFISMAQRMKVAYLLKKDLTYAEIMEKTGASSATISRVNRSYAYGNGSYDMVFERIN